MASARVWACIACVSACAPNNVGARACADVWARVPVRACGRACACGRVHAGACVRARMHR